MFDIDKLLNRLEAAEKDRIALRAKIAEMEKQEPVEWQCRSRPSWGDHQWSNWKSCSPGYAQDITKSPTLHDWQYEARPLYALPGAQPAPSVPDGWKLVPIEPTTEIRKAMHYAYWKSPQLPYHDGSPELWNAVYAALLEVAPEAK